MEKEKKRSLANRYTLSEEEKETKFVITILPSLLLLRRSSRSNADGGSLDRFCGPERERDGGDRITYHAALIPKEVFFHGGGEGEAAVAAGWMEGRDVHDTIIHFLESTRARESPPLPPPSLRIISLSLSHFRRRCTCNVLSPPSPYFHCH